MSRILFALLGLMLIPVSLLAQKDSLGTIVDEVIWVVGDEAILKSDVEALRIQGQQEGMLWKGDPDTRANSRSEIVLESGYHR